MKVRLNKYLASAGIAARRKCDDLIAAGKVQVNGKVVDTVGTVIDDDTDVVEYNGVLVQPESKLVYIMLNKPSGFVTTMDDEFSRKKVIDLITVDERVFPVGRLDYETTGLLLMTNDGQLANQMAHPRFKIEKVYQVLLNRIIKPVDLYHFEHGIELEGRKTQPCKATEIRIADNRSLLEIRIREGRNRQIRRMFTELSYKVEQLDRLAVGPIKLTGLRRGEWRFLTEDEIESLKQEVFHGDER
jgi:pseudouridine synthase